MPKITTSSKKKTSTKTSKVSAKPRQGGKVAPRPAPAASAGPAREKHAAKPAAAAPIRGKSPAHPAPVEVLPPRQSVEEALAALPYREGQFVVHPKYGLGQIERILERRLTTHTVPCVEISFSYQGMRLTIPVDQVERSGLRRPIGRREIDGIFKVLKGRATFDAKRRSAKRVVDYRKRLGQGAPTSLAEAVRDLGRLSLKKSLSYEERKILTTALRILSREVALARGREPDDVRQEIERIVYR